MSHYQFLVRKPDAAPPPILLDGDWPSGYIEAEGVECRKDEGVIDEIPGAYKDIDTVMAAQTELVDIVHTLKQVLCVKG